MKIVRGPGRLFIITAAWIFAILLLCFTVWTRSYLSQRYVLFGLAGLLLVGILLDFRPDSWARALPIRALIVVGLFLASVMPMLWFLYDAWDHEFVTWWSAGPLLPYSDAAGYVNGAKSLLTFGQLEEYSARRPLGVYLLSSVFELTNQNYQTALIMVAVLWGLATFFAARETWITGGINMALLYLTFCYLAFFEFVPCFMTEAAGYIFGSMAYVFLLSAFRESSFGQALSGFGLLIAGLLARAGAMFVVPVLGLYLIYFFSNSWGDAIRKAVMVAIVGGLVITLDPLLARKTSPPGAEYQGTSAYTFYGIAAGGKGWDYVLSEHPEIYQIVGDGNRCRYVYSLFWHRIKADPRTFFFTLFDSFLFAMKNAAPVFYGQVRLIPSAIPAGLAAVGLIFLTPSAIKRRGPFSFLPPTALGVLFSSPFLLDVGFRIMMATIPFQLALAACALAVLFPRTRAIYLRMGNGASTKTNAEAYGDAEYASSIWRWSRSGFAILLVTMVSVFPLAASIRATPTLNRLRQAQRQSSESVIIYYNPESGVLIEDKSRVPGVMSASFQAILRSPYFAKDLNLEHHMVSGDYLVHALFLPERADQAYILFDRLPDTHPGYLRVNIRLLEHKGEASLYQAESFSRFD